MSPVTRGEFLVSTTLEVIEWNLVLEGIEIAVISRDPNQAGSALVIRVKHRDGILTEWVEM